MMSHSRPLFLHFRLFLFKCTNRQIKFCQCWDSNRRSLVSEATTLPAEPPTLPKALFSIGNELVIIRGWDEWVLQSTRSEGGHMKGLFTSMVSLAANTCLASDSTSYQTLLICFTQKNLEDKKMMKGKIKVFSPRAKMRPSPLIWFMTIIYWDKIPRVNLTLKAQIWSS